MYSVRQVDWIWKMDRLGFDIFGSVKRRTSSHIEIARIIIQYDQILGGMCYNVNIHKLVSTKNSFEAQASER